MNAKILVVDDDRAHLTMLRAILERWDFTVKTAENGASAVALAHEEDFDAILTDVRMAEMDGLELLSRLKARNPYLPVLIMTAYSSLDTAVKALKEGACDYLQKPLDFDELRQALDKAIQTTRRPGAQAKTATAAGEIIGRAPAMRELLGMIASVAPSSAPVLILGESGTGKELVARALHQGSPRAGRPMIAVNCAALAENLLESELFGHEKGAFTGALKQREGRFVQADKGTLFLDEIGEMAQPLQAKLLRALQQGEVQRVGGDKPLHVDVRVIAATNRDLEAEVRAGRFREDLYYRLNVISLVVPPLRARTEDIPELAAGFLARFAAHSGKKFRGFSPRAMALLLRHAWPGNVRELENTVERAVILAPGELITEDDLPPALRENAPLATSGSSTPERGPESGSLENAEKEAVRQALAQAGGNKSEAARILGVTRVTLRGKMKKFGLE